MDRTTNARIAGFAYLTYMAVGASNEFLMGRATHAVGVSATLARIAAHGTDVRVSSCLRWPNPSARWCWRWPCTRSRATRTTNLRCSR